MRPAAAVAGAFTDATGGPPEGVWAAPGRVKLIGEHTDYTGGFVLPLALPLGVVCAAAGRDDGLLSIRSAQVPVEVRTVDLRRVSPGEVGGWASYAVGVAWAFRERWGVACGADLLVDGDVPAGAGLSSSAALECVVATVLRDLSDAPLTADDLARVARQAENDFVGAPTGVMDQLAAMHGRAGHVLFIDTRSGEIEPVPFDPGSAGADLVVVDTRAPPPAGGRRVRETAAGVRGGRPGTRDRRAAGREPGRP